MKTNELRIGLRVWHPIFGHGTLRMPPNEDKSLVTFDFTECSYYVIGKGYVTYTQENMGNVIYLPNNELYDREMKPEELPKLMHLKMADMNATVK